MQIILYGRIPSKKNSKQIVFIKGRPLLIASKKHKEWHKEQSIMLVKHRIPEPIEQCKIHLSFYAPDKRHADLSNKTESILDLLVDNHIITDDNWFVCPHLTLELIEVDKENPRVVIDIEVDITNI